MKTSTLAIRLPATASVLALAATFLAAPAAAAAVQAAPQPESCAAIQDPAQRQACADAATQADPLATTGEATSLPAGAPAAAEGAEEGLIVVTGSRIRRSEFTTSDPIQIINPQLGAQQGQIQTVELINSTPIAAGSVQITSAISTNFVTNGGEGAQTVSLRGLGAERTLVLLNGRRAGPAGVRGGVASFDLNTLPSAIVGSIEILKTGASSIYGSDAIAGVVNVITRKETKGIELRGFSSVPTRGGGETYDVSATYGKDFGRGHFLVTADYFRQNDLKRSDRKYLGCQEEFFKYEDGRRADIVDARTGQPACNGVLNNSILTNNDFTGPGFSPGLIGPNGQQLFVSQFAVGSELNGVCVPLNGIRPGVVAPSYAFGCNFDGPSTGVLNQYGELEANTDAISALTRKTIYAEGSFEVTPGIELYTELLYNNRKTKTDGLAQVSVFQFTGNSILPYFFCDPSANNCSPFDAGDPFNNEFEGNFLLRPLVLNAADSGTDIDYYRGVIGARGELGFARGFTWDIYGQYSKSDGDYFQDITLADSVATQDFRTFSCVGQTTPVGGRPCIDIDFTDPRVLRGDYNAAERAFLFDRDFGNTVFKQYSGEATISGDLIRLPAGPLGIAAGVQIRRDQIRDIPGENSQAGNSFGLSSAGITAGKTLTREIFGEVEIPLIHDTPMVKLLTFSAAGRITRVKAERRDGEGDKFGDETWKLGANWVVNDWLRFRGSMGTSFRAPALFELFLESQTGFQPQQNIDICIAGPPGGRAQRLANGQITQAVFDNCAAAGVPDPFTGATGGATIIGGGGLGFLDPETSKAKTLGLVVTPKFGMLPDTRISLAVDYFDIEVNDEISTLGASSIVSGCYNSEDFANEPLCDLITRLPAGDPAAFNISEIRDTYINVNSQKNRGIDFTGRIDHDLGKLGRISLLAQMTWQLKDIISLFEGTEVQANGNAGDPKWVGDFNLTYANGPWTLVYGLDVIGATSNRSELKRQLGGDNVCRTSLFRPGAPAGQPRVPYCPDVKLGATDYHALSLTRRVGERFEMTLGVANLFDTKPPRASTVTTQNGNISSFGQIASFGSQYDLLGRRFFVNVRGNF